MRVLTILLLALFFSACSKQADTSTASSANPSTQDVSAPEALSETSQTNTATNKVVDERDRALIVASVGDQTISKVALDQSIAKELYELEWAQYELRRKGLVTLVNSRVEGSQDPSAQPALRAHPDVEILLRPPPPPRVNWLSESQPGLGSDRAPVRIDVFCNYQSIHCARMQPIYESLLKEYSGQIRLVLNELPMKFHPFAFSASIAARCAAAEEMFHAYHQALWVDQGALVRESYLRIAAQLRFDTEKFESCLDDVSTHDVIRATAEQAMSEGLSKVPITLVNGLYLSGPKSLNTLRYFIDQELAASGHQSKKTLQLAEASINETKLRLRLEGILGAEQSQQALIQHIDAGSSHVYQLRGQVLPGVLLVAFEGDAVLLDNQGVIERLSLSASVVERGEVAKDLESAEAVSGYTDQALEDVARAMDASGNVLDSDELPPADIEFQFRGVVAPKGQTPLSREWLNEQLQNQGELEKSFQPAALEVEGTHLLKLSGTGEQAFYETLGLQDGDVVMRVNGEWVHEAQNNLFSELENGNEVSVILMRKGLPVHYKYAIN